MDIVRRKLMLVTIGTQRVKMVRFGGILLDVADVGAYKRFSYNSVTNWLLMRGCCLLMRAAHT